MELENKIESVKIQGFRSLKDVELNNLPNAAVLIGPNGSGKSNFIRFFEMLQQMVRHRRLGEFVARNGGADDQLFKGRAHTPKMTAEIRLGGVTDLGDYKFTLTYGPPDRLIFTEEAFRFTSFHIIADGLFNSLFDSLEETIDTIETIKEKRALREYLESGDQEASLLETIEEEIARWEYLESGHVEASLFDSLFDTIEEARWEYLESGHGEASLFDSLIDTIEEARWEYLESVHGEASLFDSLEEAPWQYLDSGHREANLVLAAQTPDFVLKYNSFMAREIVDLLRSCAVYQFHDTSESSKFKQGWDVGDKYQLLSHGGNLAAVLYRLEQEDIRRYELICKQIGRVLPGFERFAIEEEYGKVILRWKAKWSDKIIGAHLTSDGSLRFFALVTLLNLPPEMLPDVILLDEPELGLHPAAIALLGGMIKSLSTQKQVIVATQSPLLVDSFNLDEIFVLELIEGETKVTRPKEEELHHWLEEYSTGELWQKNLLGGRP